MNFFLDENFPKSAGRILSEKNYRVFDIRSTEHEGAGDSEMFQMAQEKQAIFLTTDKDFYHTIPFQFKDHFGVAIFALRQPNREKLIFKLEYFLENFDVENFRLKVVLFKDNHYTIFEK